MLHCLRKGFPLWWVVFELWASALVHRVALFSVPSSRFLRDVVARWVMWGGRFSLAHIWWLSVVVRPGSFQVGFEPLYVTSLRALLQPSLFLGVLTAATCLREFRALSSGLPFVGSDAYLSSVPQFVDQSELLTLSVPRSFSVESLSDFVGGLDDALLLCPARALCICLSRPSFVDPVRLVAPLTPCLRLQYPSFTRGQSCEWGVSP